MSKNDCLEDFDGVLYRELEEISVEIMVILCLFFEAIMEISHHCRK